MIIPVPANRLYKPQGGRYPGVAGMVRSMLFALAAGGSCSATPGPAVDAIEARLAALSASQFKWDQRQAMRLSGVPVYVKSFSSSDSALRAAQSLAAHSDIFQRMLAVRNKLVLSGLQAGWHWLAEIGSTTAGSSGYVSALYVGSKHSSPVPPLPDAAFDWLPPGAQRQFSQQILTKPGMVLQQVYRLALAPQALGAYLEKKLRGAGWVGEPAGIGQGGASIWRRRHASLFLFPCAHVNAGDTLLFVSYTE